MENNTLNENASADCNEKDAKTTSFREGNGEREVWRRSQLTTTLRSAAPANRG